MKFILIEAEIAAVKSFLSPLQGKLAVSLNRAKDFSIHFQVVINLTNWSSAIWVKCYRDS